VKKSSGSNVEECLAPVEVDSGAFGASSAACINKRTIRAMVLTVMNKVLFHSTRRVIIFCKFIASVASNSMV